ncbi:hypothetical protein DMENIID0001_164910 [Sergentomyia squamirostris]
MVVVLSRRLNVLGKGGSGDRRINEIWPEKKPPTECEDDEQRDIEKSISPPNYKPIRRKPESVRRPVSHCLR